MESAGEIRTVASKTSLFIQKVRRKVLMFRLGDGFNKHGDDLKWDPKLLMFAIP